MYEERVLENGWILSVGPLTLGRGRLYLQAPDDPNGYDEAW